MLLYYVCYVPRLGLNGEDLNDLCQPQAEIFLRKASPATSTRRIHVRNAIVGSEQDEIERSNAMFILSEYSDAIGTLTLNRPARRNALSEALVEELIAALAEFQQA
jgi:hypothetical protein